MILLIGSEGSMGRRYQAIFKYLQLNYLPYDISKTNRDIHEVIAPFTRDIEYVVIASPTKTHYDYIELFLDFEKPILCEKPISTDITDVRVMMEKLLVNQTDFQMMAQYKMFNEFGEGKNHSSYNFYNHGNDGLAWDCIQILGLATGKVQLKENSPVWECVINGCKINIAQMDWAYLSFVSNWIGGERFLSINDIWEWHERANIASQMEVYHIEGNKSINWNPSTLRFDTTT